ncbi:hypothetical protein LCGC14_1656100 [marine sediment metagenome]|uniref:Uncharacterized protein n=1 Tax=marine sediment metagenome TaxID=412755 RepID=A0A0F9HW14_9ZZZZ
MNGPFCIILAIVAALSGCAGHSGSRVMDLPPNPHRGAPRALLNVLQPITRGRHHRIEFALLGAPRYESLRNLIAYRFSILVDGKIFQRIDWVNPRISRYFVWVIPGNFTRKIRNNHITVYVEVCNLAGYTYSGTPLLTEPFTRTSVQLHVSHPVAGGQFGKHFETSYPVL